MIKLYQVYDVKAETHFGPIIAVRHEKAALRIYYDALTDKQSNISKHPEDYNLVYLGQQDEETGLINSEPETIMKGETWLNSQLTKDREEPTNA